MHETFDTDILSSPGHGGHRRLGIVGGGQLASMTTAAARRLGCDVVVLERYAFSPASLAAGDTMIGDWDDAAVLERFAAGVDVVTLENEFVSVDALAAIEAKGAAVWPSTSTLRLVQDKLTQKRTLAGAGLAVTSFAGIASADELRETVRRFGLPVVLKTRRNGYDGKGNVTIKTPEEIDAAWQRLGAGTTPLYVEAFCPFEREVATIVTRGIDGRVAVYPLSKRCNETTSAIWSKRRPTCRRQSRHARLTSRSPPSRRSAASAVSELRCSLPPTGRS